MSAACETGIRSTAHASASAGPTRERWQRAGSQQMGCVGSKPGQASFTLEVEMD